MLKWLSWSIFSPLTYIGVATHWSRFKFVQDLWGYMIYTQLLSVSDTGSLTFFVANLLHSPPRHDHYSWQTGLISDILSFIMQLCLQVFRSNPQDGWSLPKSSISFFLPREKSNLYFCGFDNWVSFKSVNMVTLSFFRRDQRSLTLHESISSSCTWLYSSNVFFSFSSSPQCLGRENVNIDRTAALWPHEYFSIR